MEINQIEVLLHSGYGYPTWALINLILGAAGVVFAVVAAIRAIVLKKQEKDDAGAKRRHGTEKMRKYCRFEWFAATLVLGIVGIAMFLLAEDIRGQMVLVDNWTIVNLIIFVVEFACYEYAFDYKGDDIDNEAYPG